jgi:TolB-like protein/tetratricopeptide (TPR) repeat protein
LAYAAFAFAALHAATLLSDALEWPHAIVRALTLVLIIGLVIAPVLAWYHGVRALKRVSIPELILIVLLLVIGGTLLWRSPQPAAEHISVDATHPVSAPPMQPSAAAVAFAPPAHSIAVLPFADMSEKKDQEYFADGIAEELLDLLAKTPGFHVPGRTSSFYFKGKQTALPDIARALNVGHVLEGSVRRSANRVRVTAQLIRADTGYHVWSDTYDRTAGDLFKVQDEICVAVANALRVTLESGVLQVARTDNPDAYTLYLQAHSVFQLGTKEGYETAVGYLHQAVKLDPSFAAAWADIAKVRVRQWNFGYLPLQQAAEEARRAAQQALALNPQLAAAHLSMGRVHYLFDWDWQAAETDTKRAIELDPGNADAYRWASYVAGTLGRFDTALALAKQAVAKDPLEPLNYEVIAGLHYRTSRYAEAEAAWRKAHELNPELIGDNYILNLLVARGDWTTALDRISQKPGPDYDSAVVFYASGRTSDSDRALQNLIRLRAEDDSMSIAEVYAFRGENDRAFAWLDRAYSQHDIQLVYIQGEPLLKNLTRDPRYKAFLQKMKLPE